MSERMNDAVPHEAIPEAIDDRPCEPAVLGMGHQGSELAQALGLRSGGIDIAEFGKEPASPGRLADGFVAAVNLQRPLRVDGSETVGFVEFPPINEAVVTGGALEIDAEEALPNALRELDLDRLSGADIAAPLDAVDKAAALVGEGGDEFAGELVEGHVGDEGVVEPLADLRASACDEAGAAVVVAEEIVPEGEPVLGVVDIAREQGIDQSGALVRRWVVEEGRPFVGCGKEADEIEVGAPEKSAVVERRRPGEVLFLQVARDESVDGMISPVAGRRELDLARGKRRFVGGLLEREALFPRQTFRDPLLQQGDFVRGERVAFRRHSKVFVIGRHDLDQDTGVRLRQLNDMAVLAAFEQGGAVIHGKTALLLVASVAIGAVLAQERHDLVGKIDGGSGRREAEDRCDEGEVAWGEGRHGCVENRTAESGGIGQGKGNISRSKLRYGVARWAGRSHVAA